MSLPLTALLIGLSQQEGVWLSAGAPWWHFGPQLQFGPPAEALMSRGENLLQKVRRQSVDGLAFTRFNNVQSGPSVT